MALMHKFVQTFGATSIFIATCLTVSAADASEMERKLEKWKAEYEHVTSEFRLVDFHFVDEFGDGRGRADKLYMDPKSYSLHRCISIGRQSNASGVCSKVDPEASKWEDYDVRRGRELKAKPALRISLGLVYALEGTEPFSQSTQYTYFHSRNTVHRCRSTFTQYAFKYYKEGKTVFYESAKPDKLTGECEQLTP
jgi:hypothetical protein